MGRLCAYRADFMLVRITCIRGKHIRIHAFLVQGVLVLDVFTNILNISNVVALIPSDSGRLPPSLTLQCFKATNPSSTY